MAVSGTRGRVGERAFCCVATPLMLPIVRQELAIVGALAVIGSLLVEFWLGSSFDRATLYTIQAAWVGGVVLGGWLRHRFGRSR